ncbi:hypothetical protein J6864_11160 [Liquorilactobacillus nagelii]|nr:hypothetical protein J6864_11160 [Liquorilactobacillus nagelii]
MLYGTQKINNEVYTFDKITGALKENVKNGQYQENGHWYLYKDNIKQTGFQYITDQHKTVYYNNQGQMLYGQQQINGHWYLFDNATGTMETGFQYIASQHKTVYYNNQGQMLYGWQTIQGKKYYFETSTGARTEGKASINGNEYNFDKDGVLIVSAPTFTGVDDTSVKKSAGSRCQVLGYSRVIIVLFLSPLPNSKCLCSIIRVKGVLASV